MAARASNLSRPHQLTPAPRRRQTQGVEVGGAVVRSGLPGRVGRGAVLAVLLLQALAARADPRPDGWAKALAKPGLPNLFEVTPGIFRSAQPDPEGFKSAEAMGIKTVLNLRAGHSDASLAAGTKLRRVDTPIGTDPVDRVAVLAAVRAVMDSAHPVLVHCQQGADRTGLVIAAWRIVVFGWPKESAIREMREGGYGFHEELVGFVRFLQDLDVEWFRQELSLSGGREAAPPKP